jgi:hypothetical protein
MQAGVTVRPDLGAPWDVVPGVYSKHVPDLSLEELHEADRNGELNEILGLDMPLGFKGTRSHADPRGRGRTLRRPARVSAKTALDTNERISEPTPGMLWIQVRSLANLLATAGGHGEY